MKIVHLIQRYAPAIGGCEQWCQQISRYFVKHGHQVKVLTMKVYHEEEFFQDLSPDRRMVVLGERDQDEGVVVHRYTRTKINPWVHRFLLDWLLDKKLGIYFYGPHSMTMYFDIPRQIRDADIVHLHGMHYPHNFIGFLWAKLLGKKIVMIPHFHPGHPYYERSSHYWLMKHCDLVLTVSEIERQHLIKNGMTAEKIVTLGNSIDPSEYEPQNLAQFKADFFRRCQIPIDEKIITFLGRRVEYKGIEYLINAVSMLREKGRKIRLVMAGPSFQWFDQFYHSLTIPQRDCLIDLGVISHREKVGLLHLSDIVALPSQYEAFGIIFLEAWACGTPVIGTTEGAMAELIEGAGKAVSYGNARELSQAMDYLLTNTEQADAMAERGKQRVKEHYTIERMGGRVLEIFGRLTVPC